MVKMTGGFGPISISELTGLLSQVAAHQAQQLQHAVLHDVQYRAGHYYAIAEVHAHPPDGPTRKIYYGLTTANVPAEAHGHHATVAGTNIFVWQHPTDPLLPGLGLAATPTQVQRHFAPERELTGLHTIIYRPMNRAVFQAQFAPRRPAGLGETIFLKVLRAGEAQPLYTLHWQLAAAGVPVVEPVTLPVADVLPLAGGQGMPLGEYTRMEGVKNRFDPLELVDILERFPPQVMQLPHRPSWADRHQEFIRAAQVAMPHQHDRLQRLGARLERAHQGLALGPLVPTHGDLYEAHILIEPVTGRVRHVLDVDGAGPGYRVDDFACLIGHLAVLGYRDPTPWGWQAAMRTFNRLTPHANPKTLAVRAAAVVVSLIPSYQPDDEARSRGEAYLDRAEALLQLA
ncbi:MAG TPA: hypothetical protein VIG82_03040 [Enteractinococcus sp.]